MARFRHITLTTRDPVKTADFYKEVFGLQELNRKPRDTGEEGVWLTDGYIFFAIRPYGHEDVPNLGEGPSTVEGVHHIGFDVDDMDETAAACEGAGATECANSHPPAYSIYKGPDGLVIDIVNQTWDKIIKAKTQLLHLVPAPVVPASAD